MASARITRIYSRLGQLFAEQRKSLLEAAATGFKLENEQKFESRHARIVRLYEELAKLNPAAYRNEDRKRERRSGDSKAA